MSPSTSADLEHVVLGVPLGLACAVGHSRSATWQLACHCVRKIQASQSRSAARRASCFARTECLERMRRLEIRPRLLVSVCGAVSVPL